MIRQAVILALAVLASPAFGQEGDPIFEYEAQDATMNKAIASAQVTLPLFLCESVDSDGYGPLGGLLKVRVEVDHPRMNHEIIWVEPFVVWTADNFTGLLANQPHAIDGLNRGDPMDFTYDMIVDWAWYHPDGSIFGNYTTRVIYGAEGNTAELATFADPPAPQGWTCDEPAS